jgi:hypothetical protein
MLFYMKYIKRFTSYNAVYLNEFLLKVYVQIVICELYFVDLKACITGW